MELKEIQVLTEYEDIISNLKEIIKRKKLKKGAVAAKLGFSSQQFSDILHGRKLLRIEDVPLMAKALDVGIADIFLDKKVKGLDYTRVVVEEDTEDPIPIASITEESVEVADGYRVRLTPCYD